MDKRKISEEVYERYVDASVALFMEYYAVACLDGTDAPCTDEMEFPTELDTRCRALIDRECRRQRRRASLQSVGKCMAAVACLAVFLLSLSSVLFMTVDAVRVPIINYYIEQSDGYWKISSKQDIVPDATDENPIDYLDPLAKLVPEEYRLKEHIGNSLNKITAVYENSSNSQIILYTQPFDHNLTVDSEDAIFSQKCQIGGCEAILVDKDGYITLAWIHSASSTIFTITANDIEQTVVVSIAEQIIYLLNE